MSLATVVAILALAAALAAIPRRTRKPAALVSLLAILASLTAVAYATAQVAQPAQKSSGPLALVVPEGLDKPDDYHLPLEVWRAEHPLYVRSSEYGVEECLDCHDEPDTFCNQCHSYVGAARIEVAALPGAPGAEQSAGAVESPTFADNIEPLLNERCGACHIRRTRGKFSLATYDDLLTGGRHGSPIEAGDAENSLIIQVLRAPREDLNIRQMPTNRRLRLTEEEIELIARWIDAGALNN